MKRKKVNTPPAHLGRKNTEFAADLTPAMMDGGVSTWAHPDRMKAARMNLCAGTEPEDKTED